MSRKSNRLIVNCGSSALTAALVSYRGPVLRIDKIVSERLEYAHTSADAWLTAVDAALQKLTAEHQLSGPATFILPGNQVLTKTIRIPQVETSKRKEVISYEIQQSIPYALHEVVWDSQVIGDDGVETEVLVVACEVRTLEKLCACVSRTALRVAAIRAAPVLDYNTFRFVEPEPKTDVLWVHVGVRASSLLYVHANGFFARHLGLVTSMLPRSSSTHSRRNLAVAETMPLKSEEAARGGEDDSESARERNGSLTAFVRRMRQEIDRSMVRYRRQQGIAAPVQIRLSGCDGPLKLLADELETSTQIAVRTFDPLQAVTFAAGAAESAAVLKLAASAIVGEAICGQITNPAMVDLLPDAACLALAPWTAFFSCKQSERAYRAQAAELTALVQPLSSKQSVLAELTATASALRDEIRGVEALIQSKANWIQFCAELQASLTQIEDVWLDSLIVTRSDLQEGDSGTTIILSGEMLVREPIHPTSKVDRALLTRRIKQLQSNFLDSEFVVAAKQPVIRWTKLNEGLNVLPFVIHLSVDATQPL
jgi:type IV pilus assembly protein PilM